MFTKLIKCLLGCRCAPGEKHGQSSALLNLLSEQLADGKIQNQRIRQMRPTFALWVHFGLDRVVFPTLLFLTCIQEVLWKGGGRHFVASLVKSLLTLKSCGFNSTAPIQKWSNEKESNELVRRPGSPPARYFSKQERSFVELFPRKYHITSNHK